MGDMDSGNSGSILSSSTGGGCGGDDQEYDSSHGGATESISAFFNGYNENNININTTTQLYSFNGSSSFTSQTLPQVEVPNYFSSLECPNFINNTTNNNNSNSNNNNNNNKNNNIDNNRNNQLDIVWPNKFPSISTNDTNCTYNNITNNNPQQKSPTPLPLPAQGPTTSPRSGPGSRNPKKRTRASRRAPTTVLTTDTTNFRQMVQEFTGIPAPPFSPFSSSPRNRFDLFTGLTGHPSNNSSIVLQPPFLSSLLRPFPQKITHIQQPQFLANNTTTTTNNDHININTNTNNNNNTLGLLPTSTTFQLCDPPQDYVTSTSNNQQINFQSFLQSSDEKYSTLPPLIQQDSGMSMRRTSVSNSNTAQISCSVNNNNPTSGNYLGISTNNNNSNTSINGGSDSIGVVVTKGSEGMVDSWICSSD